MFEIFTDKSHISRQLKHFFPLSPTGFLDVLFEGVDCSYNKPQAYFLQIHTYF